MYEFSRLVRETPELARRELLKAFVQAKYDSRVAAERLGISRYTFVRRAHDLELTEELERLRQAQAPEVDLTSKDLLGAFRKMGMHAGRVADFLGINRKALARHIDRLHLHEALAALKAKALREGWHHEDLRHGGRPLRFDPEALRPKILRAFRQERGVLRETAARLGLEPSVLRRYIDRCEGLREQLNRMRSEMR